MVICLEWIADLHMAQLIPLPLTVSCSSKIQIGFTFMVLAYLGSPGKRVVKRVYVCVSVIYKIWYRHLHSSTFVECIQWITHTHTRLTALCPRLPKWASTRKVKPIWILLKQQTVSGSGIRWAICNSAPHSRQITIPEPHRCFFTGWMLFLPPSQQRQSTEGGSSGLTVY